MYFYVLNFLCHFSIAALKVPFNLNIHVRPSHFVFRHSLTLARYAQFKLPYFKWKIVPFICHAIFLPLCLSLPRRKCVHNVRVWILLICLTTMVFSSAFQCTPSPSSCLCRQFSYRQINGPNINIQFYYYYVTKTILWKKFLLMCNFKMKFLKLIVEHLCKRIF